MSLKDQQYKALIFARDYLRAELTPQRPKTAKERREKAYRCLKHFPFLKEDGEPIFSKY